MNKLNALKTFAIHTLGCKVNIYDSNIIRNQLLSYGLIEVDFNSVADLYIINTCSVTNQADSKSRLFINKTKQINPNSITLVCGCYSQVEQKINNADIIIGNKFKNNIIKLLEEYLAKKTKFIKVENLLLEENFENTNINDFKFHTRAFVKIQEGCNFMCAYCIIPFARGRQRSKPHMDIINEISNLIKNGYKEIVLTGVNTAGYLDKDVNFEKLLYMINDLPGDFRIRISSMEPFQINDNMIKLICNNPKFCQHWHICLQSGSDEVLTKMNRKYSTSEYKLLINKIYNLNPFSSICTDYICGFPTETNSDHLDSLKFCEDIKFYQMHIFPYSIRKNTPASLMPQIDPKIKKQRVDDFINLNNKLENAFLQKFINKTVDVLIETKINDNQYIGKSSEYFEVIVESNQDIKNQLIKVKITKNILNKLFGIII